ncbi:dehydrodolichyl diphosphate synthase complex subunit DHDDS [Chelonus insularis]|uniref:dehydrodolichyl diphosphate synthase complex subunit DHDDS n=1 Tax=Chelonus insularis TaxID=460826 RepID=UPI00158BC63D|nr:dehydrodolichyl diphosphate synthase complex subunit DHDDS [Chelonus insularis]
MSWIKENTSNILQLCAMKIIKNGPIPRHVAFIMDGNRRYADKKRFNSLKGHTDGFNKLAHTLQWCLDLGIKEVTVYAFSIENFKRSHDEVNGLLKLAEEKFTNLLDERDKLMEHGIKICVIGNFTLIPDKLSKIMRQSTIITKDNKQALLNIAFAYTSRDEITQTIKSLSSLVNVNQICIKNIDEKLFSNNLYTYQSSNPDLLIRTSGEVRFSDFLLWQISDSYIHFTKSLWPEYTVWDFLKAIFFYQRYCDINNADTISTTKL